MDKKLILENQIRQAEQELGNAYMQLASQQAKIEDAATTTGNPAVDKSLADAAVIAQNTIVMINRIISTRESAISRMQAEIEAVK